MTSRFDCFTKQLASGVREVIRSWEEQVPLEILAKMIATKASVEVRNSVRDMS